MRLDLRLSSIVSHNLILDFSHQALTLFTLKRYLTGICNDLNQNRHIRKIHFLFNSKFQNENVILEKLNKLINIKTFLVLFF